MTNTFREFRFLDDQDFCDWVLGRRPDLKVHFMEMARLNPEDREAMENAAKVIRMLDDEKIVSDPDRKKEIWQRIIHQSRISSKTTPKQLFFRYAAVWIPLALIGISAIVYFLTNQVSHPDFSTVYNRQELTETRLLLENGQEILIPGESSEIVVDGTTSTLKVNDQKIDFSGKDEKTEFSQLIVPFGKRSRIVLSDSSIVWLNAGSRLIYPTRFEKRERVVGLEGEGFFEVKADKEKTFVVETSHSRIRVLGTKFNVKAYPDENLEETILAEGSVNFGLRGNPFGKNITLKPEERLSLSLNDKKYEVSTVDVSQYTSWIEGILIFTDTPLPEVLKRISRHYNISIKHGDELISRVIQGKLDLKEDSHKVLDALAIISNGYYEEKEEGIYFSLNP